MKKLKLSNVQAYIAFVALGVLIAGCGKDEGTKVEMPLVEQAKKLAGEWTIAKSGVQRDDSPTTVGDWSGFKLKITGDKDGGTFLATGVPDDFKKDVWPENSKWKFMGTDSNMLLRTADKTEVEMTVSGSTDATLTLTFDVKAPGNTRSSDVSGIPGTWKFTFTK